MSGIGSMITVVGATVALAWVGIAYAAPGHHAAPHTAAAHVGSAALAAPAPARAAVGGWTTDQCGREPAAPAVETGTVDSYNASIDRVTAYESDAKKYNSCVSRAATAEQTAVSNEARNRIDAIQAVSSGVQKRIAANFTALTAALRNGTPKPAR